MRVTQDNSAPIGSPDGAPVSRRARLLARLACAGVVVAFAIGVTLVVLVVRSFGMPGEEVGSVTVPGQITLALRRGDRLRTTADTEVAWPRSRRGEYPIGCRLVLDLQMAGFQRTVSCDPYRLDDGSSVVTMRTTGTRGGAETLSLTGSRLSCGFVAPADGTATLRATAAMDTCVRRSFAVVVHVYRESSGDP